jgi:hypothetical protein
MRTARNNLEGSATSLRFQEEKNANLVCEVVLDVRFGHELANREF